MDSADKCGHNFPPKECPYERCGFREALALLATAQETAARLERIINAKEANERRLLGLLKEVQEPCDCCRERGPGGCQDGCRCNVAAGSEVEE